MRCVDLTTFDDNLLSPKGDKVAVESTIGSGLGQIDWPPAHFN